MRNDVSRQLHCRLSGWKSTHQDREDGNLNFAKYVAEADIFKTYQDALNERVLKDKTWKYEAKARVWLRRPLYLGEDFMLTSRRFQDSGTEIFSVEFVDFPTSPSS